MTTYPTNVVPYNLVRYNTPDTPTGDDVIVAYRLPADMVYLLTGAVSTLQDVNNWRERGTLTPQEAVDVFVNEVERVDICELVADCIRTSQDVQDAIAQNGGAGATTIINNTIYSNQTIVSGDLDANGCSNDAKFGRIVALINYIDTVQNDFFQSIDAATNIIQEVANIVNAIPIIETLPFDNLIAFVGNTGEKWDDSYAASVNTQLKEAFACELWCQYGQSNCDITIKDVRQAIEARYNLDTTQGQLNALTAANMIARIATTVASAGGATYIGDDFVYISWLLQIAAVELTGQFFGVDIVDYANSSSNQPTDTAWSACEPCPDDWTHVIDLTQPLPSYVGLQGTTTHQVGVGLIGNYRVYSGGANSRVNLTFEVDIGTAYDVRAIRVDLAQYQKCGGMSGSNQNFRMFGLSGGIKSKTNANIPNGTPTWNVQLNSPETAVNGRWSVEMQACSVAGLGATGTIVADRIVISGTGPDPFP